LIGGLEPDRIITTGDPEIDDIERRLAAGEDPDKVLDGWGEGRGDIVDANVPKEDVEESYEEVMGGGAPLSWSNKEP
jgi:hypothetical protein